MNIIYHCYGGCHSSITAANIHLGILPPDSVPGWRSLMEQPLFDKQTSDDTGKIILMGKDAKGNSIYVAGRRSRPEIFLNVIDGLQEVFNISDEDTMLVDASAAVNPIMRVGGFMSRQIGLIFPGRNLAAWGTDFSYSRLACLVASVKRRLGE